MRRAAFVVVCLVLALLSLAPLPKPVAAQEELPAAFAGRWQGTVFQVNPNAEYPVAIELTGGVVGTVVGASDYSTLLCGGDLELRGISADGQQIESLVEHITAGEINCHGEGAIFLALQTDGSLFYEWTHPDFSVGSVTATLVRDGGAPAPHLIPTLEPAPALQPEAATFVTPDPAECTVTPRTVASFPAPADAPDSAMLALAAALMAPGPSVPAGVPADPMTTAAVVDTYRQFTACASAGNELASFALWTDQALRQLTIVAPAPAPAPPVAPSAFWVSDVRVLPDGRVVAVAEVRSPDVAGTMVPVTFVQVLVPQDDRFLVNETLDVVVPEEIADTLIPRPELEATLPAHFVGSWEGIVAWDDVTMPVIMNLTGGGVGDVVGTIEYALYGSSGPRCGGDVTLQRVAVDESWIDLVGIITYDPAVCLVDATVTISFQADGDFAYDWRHPVLNVSGTGNLQLAGPTN